MPTSDWDPLSTEVRDHPEDVLRDMRARCPVAYSTAFGGFYALSKYEDIEFAAKHPEIFCIEKQFVIPQQETAGIRWKPQQSDPPEHAKYRAVLQPSFARGRVRGLEPKFRQLVVQMIDESGHPDEMELCSEFTRPYTGGLLCIFLGFPDSDKHQLTDWTVEQLRAANEGDMAALVGVFDAMAEYITKLREDRVANPLPVDEDLMSAVLAARVDGEPLSAMDIEGMFKQLMGAGHETSGNTLATLLRHLAENPDLQQRLRDEPSLIPAAVDETLRMWGAVFGLVRTTLSEVEVHGRVIPEGEVVALLWTSGGRDEDINEDPDVFKLDRTNARHLSFGAGVHRCIGADLARLSLRIATEELLARTTSITLAGPPEHPGWPVNGTSVLPVRIEWAR